jgi:hypothetical protein
LLTGCLDEKTAFIFAKHFAAMAPIAK